MCGFAGVGFASIEKLHRSCTHVQDLHSGRGPSSVDSKSPEAIHEAGLASALSEFTTEYSRCRRVEYRFWQQDKARSNSAIKDARLIRFLTPGVEPLQ